MENQKFISDIKCKFHERQSSIERLINDSDLLQNLLLLYNKLLECFDNGNKLMLCGNGGSAADCQHIVAEFIVKLSKLRKSLPAISLTSNNSIITAISNDIDYNTIFTRQLEGIANPRDILIGISTSGNSQNIVSAFEYAKQNGLYTVSVTGEEGTYGLWVTTVAGRTADSSKEEWWALYKNGEFSMTGVDDTPLADGDRIEYRLTVGYN